eukprot:879961-Pelagomonas_calceolata.AAC.1
MFLNSSNSSSPASFDMDMSDMLASGLDNVDIMASEAAVFPRRKRSPSQPAVTMSTDLLTLYLQNHMHQVMEDEELLKPYIICSEEAGSVLVYLARSGKCRLVAVLGWDLLLHCFTSTSRKALDSIWAIVTSFEVSSLCMYASQKTGCVFQCQQEASVQGPGVPLQGTREPKVAEALYCNTKVQ